MICMFCGKREKCWQQMEDSLLQEQDVKCNYEDYCLDDEIELEDLLEESQRRVQDETEEEKKVI